MFDSVRQKNNFNTIIKYDLDMVSYDYDYVSISITGNVDKDKDILETKFWINDLEDMIQEEIDKFEEQTIQKGFLKKRLLLIIYLGLLLM